MKTSPYCFSLLILVISSPAPGSEAIEQVNIIYCLYSKCQQNSSIKRGQLPLGASKTLGPIEGAVIITSRNRYGESAYYHGQHFGLYMKLKKKINGAPVYRQMESSYQEAYLFKGSDYWYIGKDVDKDDGLFRSEVNSNEIPTYGWQYFVMNDEKWYKDNAIIIKNVDDSENNDEDQVCESVRISGNVRGKSKYLGQFDAIEGYFSSGRPVYKNKHGKYLIVWGYGYPEWYVCDENEPWTDFEGIECKTWGLQSSNGANSMNPADPISANEAFDRAVGNQGWGKLINGHVWRKEKEIKIECIKNIDPRQVVTQPF